MRVCSFKFCNAVSFANDEHIGTIRATYGWDRLLNFFTVEMRGMKPKQNFFAAASPTLYYRFEPKFYANFRQSEVFFNCNIHHTS